MRIRELSLLRHHDHQRVPLIDWLDWSLCNSLFLHEYHDDLLHTLRELLRPGGEAVIIAPRRGRTLAAFVERAKQDTKVVQPPCTPLPIFVL
jgi:SAM-dependent methyltransferase